MKGSRRRGESRRPMMSRRRRGILATAAATAAAVLAPSAPSAMAASTPLSAAGGPSSSSDGTITSPAEALRPPPTAPLSAAMSVDPEATSPAHGIRGSSTPSAGESRMHPIRRLYGPENASVRRELNKIETESTDYWRTGIKGDPHHVVNYKNHPFDAKNKQRRMEKKNQPQRHLQTDGAAADFTGTATATTADLEEEAPFVFQPLRIMFDTSALDATRTQSNGAQIDFIENEILPRMAKFWSETLSVVPVDGPLLISPAELANRRYCGDSEFTEVPAEHISTGVTGTDLILYVSGTPSTRFCGPSTLAVAVACNFDNYDRPIAGAINFCLDQVELDENTGTASPAIIQDNVDVAIHEAAHVLGMSSNSYRFYWNPETGEPRTDRSFKSTTVTCVDGVQRTQILPGESTMKFFVAPNGQRYASIVTEKVRAVARNQFDCQDVEGAQLENQPTGAESCTGDHWEERLFYPEALSGVISPTANIISPLTLALMEDTGWYQANYTKSSVSPFGHGIGCDFVNKPCLETDATTGETVVPDYAKSFFCSSASARGCSPAQSHKMACTVIDYSLFFPQRLPDAQFTYFQDKPSQGGPRQADYCPVYGSTYSGLQPEELDCRDPNNVDLINLYSEEYGSDSMCFETTSGEGRCYVAQCIQDEQVLKVNIRGEWKTCEYDFQQLSITVASGAISSTLTCPRIMSACPDMFCPANCAGRGICNYQSNVNGTVRPRCECFDPDDTSPGCSDSLVLDGKYLSDSTGLVDDLKEGFFDPLVAVFVDNPDTWTTSSWAWAAGLFVIFLLMLLCICSSFWPRKGIRRRKKNFNSSSAGF
mmetsp:Transcript_13379/g.28402  ORF Transcript_13379/g.28402 Transcript_13379/m.28402 type:complete len:825 (+) Transcript_13379:50-2524(+)